MSSGKYFNSETEYPPKHDFEMVLRSIQIEFRTPNFRGFCKIWTQIPLFRHHSMMKLTKEIRYPTQLTKIQTQQLDFQPTSEERRIEFEVKYPASKSQKNNGRYQIYGRTWSSAYLIQSYKHIPVA